MPHNNPLWFVPTLFSIEILAFFSRKLNHQEKAIYACFLLVAFAWCRYLKIILPWEFVLAMQGYVFYWLGNVLFSVTESKHRFILLMATLFTYCSTLFFNEGFVSNYTFPQSSNIHKMPGYFAIAICSIVMYLLIGTIILKPISNHLRLLQFLGTNTLCILCLHDPIKRILIFLYSRALGISIEAVRCDIVHSLIVLVLLIGCMIPVIIIWNRWGKPVVNKLTI